VTGLLELIRIDRERREVRLEHFQVKWLLERWRRFWKDVTNRRQVRNHPEAPKEVDANIAAALLATAEVAARGCVTAQVSVQPEKLDQVSALAGERIEVALNGSKRLTEADLERWIERRSRDLATIQLGPLRGKKGPLERGSLIPTVREYLDESMPPYISTEEEALRELELRVSIRAYQAAAAARAKRPGPAVCQGVPLEARGHVWWKVPSQPVYECIECGLEASTLRYDLQLGKVRPLGLTSSREFAKMQGALEHGRVEFLLPSGLRPETPVQLVAYEARKQLMPLVPTGLEDASPEIKRPGQRTAWLGTYGRPCENCGSVCELHRPDPDIEGRIYCPQEGIDVT
jgi:hypothetical protein